LTAPTRKHETLRDLLEDVAVLAGFCVRVEPPLDSGKRPDVLRVRPRDRLLFLGEAKSTETPGCAETRARLFSYMRWIHGVITPTVTAAVIVIAFPHRVSADTWAAALRGLAKEAGLVSTAPRLITDCMGANIVVGLVRAQVESYLPLPTTATRDFNAVRRYPEPLRHL